MGIMLNVILLLTAHASQVVWGLKAREILTPTIDTFLYNASVGQFLHLPQSVHVCTALPIKNHTFIGELFFMSVMTPHLKHFLDAFTAVQLASIPAHLALTGCTAPGYTGPGPLIGSVWECDNPYSQRDDGKGTCGSGGRSLPLFVTTEYVAPEWHFKLPEGSAIEVGGGTGINYLVLNTHYPEPDKLINGFTGTSGMKTHVTTGFVTSRVGFLFLRVISEIPPHSQTDVTGEFLFDSNILVHIFAVAVHTHSMGVDFQVWLTNASGFKTLIHRQDPKFNTNVGPVKKTAVSRGDFLTITCTFNNTSPDVIDIE